MRDTQWTETVDLDLPTLPEAFWGTAGISPVIGAVEERIGEEVMLLINDPTEGALALKALDVFELNVGSGFIDTEHGALGFVLFIVPDQDNPGAPHAVWEVLFNPADPSMTEPFERLAEQSHWHVLLTGPGPELLDVLEFRNTYFLNAGLSEITEKTAEKPCTDFAKAVVDAHDAYSLEELYQASTPEALEEQGS